MIRSVLRSVQALGMWSHNGREPGPKGLVHVSKDVSRACNGSDTRHTITSTTVDQLLIYNRTPGPWCI